MQTWLEQHKVIKDEGTAIQIKIIEILFLFLFITSIMFLHIFLSSPITLCWRRKFSPLFILDPLSCFPSPIIATKFIYFRVKRFLITALISVEVHPMMSSSKPDADLPPSLWCCCCCCWHVDIHYTLILLKR